MLELGAYARAARGSRDSIGHAEVAGAVAVAIVPDKPNPPGTSKRHPSVYVAGIQPRRLHGRSFPDLMVLWQTMGLPHDHCNNRTSGAGI